MVKVRYWLRQIGLMWGLTGAVERVFIFILILVGVGALVFAVSRAFAAPTTQQQLAEVDTMCQAGCVVMTEAQYLELGLFLHRCTAGTTGSGRI